MKIISSNIRFDNPEDGLNSWSRRKEFLSSLLNNQSPDIIGTQEGRVAQLKELDQLLINNNIIDSHRDWIKERMYPCLFMSSKLQVLESFDIWLSKTPYISGSKLEISAFPRLSTVAKIKYEGTEVLIANMHLDHTIDDAREAQIEIFISEIKKINFNGPLVLCGDFNSKIESVVYSRLIKELNLIDPWKTKKMKEETSYHQFKGAIENGHRIDWILHSSHFICSDIKLLKNSTNGYYPSDHFPLFCDIILKN